MVWFCTVSSEGAKPRPFGQRNKSETDMVEVTDCMRRRRRVDTKMHKIRVHSSRPVHTGLGAKPTICDISLLAAALT